MRKRDPKTPNGLKRKRLFGKYFIRALLIGAGLFGCLYLVLIFYPAGKMSSLITKHLSRMAGRSVSAERVSIQPLGKIEIQGLQIELNEADGFQQGSFFRLEKLGIRFALLPLIARHLDIREIFVEKPEIHLVPLPVEKKKVLPQTVSEGDHRVADVRTDSSIQTIKNLPLSIGLFRLRLQDFRLWIRLPRVEGDIEAALEGVHCEVSDLRLPRKYNESPEGVQGQIVIHSEDGPIHVRIGDMQLDLNTQLRMTAQWDKGANWNMETDIHLKPILNTVSSDIHLTLGVQGKGYGEILTIDTTGIAVGKQQLIRINGECTNLGSDAQFHLNVGGDVLNIRKFITSLQVYLSQEQMEFFRRIQADGEIQLIQGEIQGSPQQAGFALRSILKDGKWIDPASGVSVERTHFSLNVQGVFTKRGMEKGKLSGDLMVGGLSYALNDTSSVHLRDMALHLNSDLASTGIPLTGSLRGSAGHIFNGSMGMQLNWSLKSDSVHHLEPFILLGEIRLDSLNMDAIPRFPPNVHGKVNLRTQFNVNGLQDIQVYSDISSPGIVYSFNESLKGIFPVSTSVRMFLKTDPKFERVVLDSGIFTVNDLLSARMAGDYNVSGKNFNLTVDRGEIQNASLVHYLPPQLMKQSGEIKFTGMEQFSIDAQGYPVDDSLALAVHAKLRFMDVGVEYPAEQIGIRGFQGVIEVTGNSNRLHGGVDFDLDTLSFMLLRSEPLTGVKLGLGWNLQNQDSLWIENGELSIRTMGLQSDFSVHLGQLKTVPDIHALLTVAFQSEDSIEMIQGVSLSGGWFSQTSLETIDPALQHYRIGGYLSMDSLCVRQKDGLQVIHANGKIPFQMEVDLKQMSVLPDEKYRVRNWFDYDNQRDIYLSLSPTLGSITVEEIAVSGYRIQDGVLDMEAQSGRIQIPWFYMHILDGNIGGALLIDLGEGKSGDISYSVRANASRINSAALANFQSEDTEETELDASLAFQGKGINIDQGIDLEGYFHLTKIGRKFAGTLLETMDPQGTDRSIQLTRKLLGAGWKPKLFSFELRHGYVYPVLSLSQPWFSPIRIPGTLQYGRLPIEFFIRQQLTKAE